MHKDPDVRILLRQSRAKSSLRFDIKLKYGYEDMKYEDYEGMDGL